MNKSTNFLISHKINKNNPRDLQKRRWEYPQNYINIVQKILTSIIGKCQQCSCDFA